MKFISIRGTKCEITIAACPESDDRGRFVAKIYPDPGIDLFDGSSRRDEGWPRYYFFESSARKECEAWLKAHSQYAGSEWQIRGEPVSVKELIARTNEVQHEYEHVRDWLIEKFRGKTGRR